MSNAHSPDVPEGPQHAHVDPPAPGSIGHVRRGPSRIGMVSAMLALSAMGGIPGAETYVRPRFVPLEPEPLRPHEPEPRRLEPEQPDKAAARRRRQAIRLGKAGVRFRWHRGGLEESLATARSFDSRQELEEHVRNGHSLPAEAVISYQGIGVDRRCGWDTYYVMVDGQCIGMSDGDPRWLPMLIFPTSTVGAKNEHHVRATWFFLTYHLMFAAYWTAAAMVRTTMKARPPHAPRRPLSVPPAAVPRPDAHPGPAAG
jgi:hypothetical protein